MNKELYRDNLFFLNSIGKYFKDLITEHKLCNIQVVDGITTCNSHSLENYHVDNHENKLCCLTCRL